MPSKINIREIFKNHEETLRYPTGTLSRNDRRIFVYLPILIALVCVVLFRTPTSGMVNMLSLCLSVFIGMFLNLLVLIMTFVDNKFRVEDVVNRRVLLEQVFYNLSYTIVISLIALGFLIFLCVEVFPSTWVENPIWNRNEYYKMIKDLFRIDQFTANNVFNGIVSYIVYYYLSKIILTLLMIVKRIFKLFNHEIEAANLLEQANKEEAKSYD